VPQAVGRSHRQPLPLLVAWPAGRSCSSVPGSSRPLFDSSLPPWYAVRHRRCGTRLGGGDVVGRGHEAGNRPLCYAARLGGAPWGATTMQASAATAKCQQSSRCFFFCDFRFDLYVCDLSDSFCNDFLYLGIFDMCTSLELILSFFPVVHMAQHDTTCLPCRRASTTRLNDVRVMRGPRSRHGVLARHGTTTLSCPVVPCRIVSCLAVSMPCRAGRPIWTSIVGRSSDLTTVTRELQGSP
jgi:hypothetical protein